ncbi:hypothetical protein [Candidatus Contubernalis alkaliaceticus]|nr:hypothetical protein [Candidatus Contubernalis alkalaceticus]
MTFWRQLGITVVVTLITMGFFLGLLCIVLKITSPYLSKELLY